ncbi:MAG: hypothetical protein A4E65_01625 [Syntrophorhabdus sp. PtaU1.Bin153]|nr:MAG: hypothetical protein A4E65_01625 [Syntrophorhabdus sp. PtaU1.Bin153]
MSPNDTIFLATSVARGGGSTDFVRGGGDVSPNDTIFLATSVARGGGSTDFVRGGGDVSPSKMTNAEV